MRHIFRWVIGIPITLLVVAFAVANRQWTTLSLDPFATESPVLSISMPLWLLFIFGVFVGILVGWGFCWLAQGKHRKLARERGREIARLQSEIETAKSPVAGSDNTALLPFGDIGP
ncbi:MAG: LapA family protein [Alphaproteobacteria bacterium]|nr:LapA family protein [Alphaproteobacteria bacterium]